MESIKKKRVKTILLLATIWFAVSIPLPFLFNTPEESRPQLFTLIQIMGLITIPFVALAVAWTLKPELTT